MMDTLVASMTLEEKIGQLFVLAFSGGRLDQARVLMEERAVGAAYISNDNIPSARAAVELTRTLQDYAAKTRLKIPLLLGADQEGAWSVMAEDSSPGPGNMALGAAHDPGCTYEMYSVIGRELAAVGMNAVYAPCADCNSNPHNTAIGMRSFGQDPYQVGVLTSEAVRALQDNGIAATSKHFPGHGDTTVDSHRGLPTVTRNGDELRAIDLAPFARTIEAGVSMVMTSHIVFTALDPERPATLSPLILGDLLRDEMGFEGPIISDSMNMGAMKRNYIPEEAAVQAVRAGVDLIMLAEEHYAHDAERYLAQQCALLDAVARAVRSGDLSERRIDDAVRRILALKARFGLFGAPPADQLRAQRVVGCAEHRQVERRVAQRAVAVLRDAHGLVPLPSGRQVVLVNTTTRHSYDILGHTRGIGPNQTTPAFDVFARTLSAKRPDTVMLWAEDVAAGDRLSELEGDALIVAVTENYPVPGATFDQASQVEIIRHLVQVAPVRLVVVGLRDPYELENLPDVSTYVCAFSFRHCAAEAAAGVLLGECAAAGRSPVSIPTMGA
jgi:beta-N-acetylhexosaminidase